MPRKWTKGVRRKLIAGKSRPGGSGEDARAYRVRMAVAGQDKTGRFACHAPDAEIAGVDARHGHVMTLSPFGLVSF